MISFRKLYESMNYVPSSKPIPLKNRRLNFIIKVELFYEKGFFHSYSRKHIFAKFWPKRLYGHGKQTRKWFCKLIFIRTSGPKVNLKLVLTQGTNLLQPVIRTDFGLIFRVKESENIKIKSKFFSLVNLKCMIIPFIFKQIQLA